MQSEAPRTWG